MSTRYEIDGGLVRVLRRGHPPLEVRLGAREVDVIAAADTEEERGLLRRALKMARETRHGATVSLTRCC